MARQKDFPLEEFRDDLKNIQTALEKAEVNFSKDKDLVDSIREAKDSATTVANNLKFDRKNS